MSSCRGDCGCGTNSVEDAKCFLTSVSEAKGVELFISGVGPLVEHFIGVLEMVDAGYDVSEGCNCGKCGCDPCTWK